MLFYFERDILLTKLKKKKPLIYVLSWKLVTVPRTFYEVNVWLYVFRVSFIASKQVLLIIIMIGQTKLEIFCTSGSPAQHQ